jgi:hypothetical protein
LKFGAEPLSFPPHHGFGYSRLSHAKQILRLTRRNANICLLEGAGQPVEQSERVYQEQQIMRSGEAGNLSLCQYKMVSCVRCCLPHIGGDSHMEDSDQERSALLKKDGHAYRLKYSGRYLGPGMILMKFKNFNPLKDPRIEASKYEDSFPDVGKKEMEKRFTERRKLFLSIYDREQPRQSLLKYVKAAQTHEGYTYTFEVNTGLASLFLGGSVPSTHSQKGSLPECQLLGYLDGQGRVGCMAHPFAETSHGHDGRDLAGFFHHTGCCDSAGCEASKEFRFLSPSAIRVFAGAIEGMSWYEYSRHSTSVLVYYLRCYDRLLQRLDEKGLLDSLTLEQIVSFTNSYYDEWPLRQPDATGESKRMNSLDILSMDIPLAERIMFIALDTWFQNDHLAAQMKQAESYFSGRVEALCSECRRNSRK